MCVSSHFAVKEANTTVAQNGQHPCWAVADELLATIQSPTKKKWKQHLDKVFWNSCKCDDATKCTKNLKYAEKYVSRTNVITYFEYLALTQSISYDIVCQWHIELVGRHVVFLVPKFHLPTHGASCQTAFSFNLTCGVRCTDGKAPEHGWSQRLKPQEGNCVWCVYCHCHWCHATGLTCFSFRCNSSLQDQKCYTTVQGTCCWFPSVYRIVTSR